MGEDVARLAFCLAHEKIVGLQSIDPDNVAYIAEVYPWTYSHTFGEASDGTAHWFVDSLVKRQDPLEGILVLDAEGESALVHVVGNGNHDVARRTARVL